MVPASPTPLQPAKETTLRGFLLKHGFHISRLSFAGLFAASYIISTWLPFKTFCLFFLIALPLSIAIEVIGEYLPLLSAGRSSRDLSGSIAMIAAALYHIALSNSRIWTAVAYLFLLYGALALYGSAGRILNDFFILDYLRRRFALGLPAEPPAPILYIVGEPGLGMSVTNRLVGKISRALWQQTFTRGGSMLVKPEALPTSVAKHMTSSLISGGRVIMFCLAGNLLTRYPEDFRSWIIRNSHAFVAVTLSPGWAARRKPEVIATATLWSCFRQDLAIGSLHCQGPTFEIQVSLIGSDPLVDQRRADTFIELPWPVPGRSFEDAIVPLVQRAANTSVQIAKSDAAIEGNLRANGRSLGEYGLAPIADAYLRARLAQSDVERFNNLIDAIEAVVRLSAIILLVEHWSQGNRPELTKEIRWPLTFGGWLKLLGLVVREAPKPSLMALAVRRFFVGEVLPSQIKLRRTEAAKATGIIEAGFKDQLDWFNWFVHFRNVTKGHGQVDEHIASDSWNDLHAAFLETVNGLDYLMINSALYKVRSNRAKLISGWYRQGQRAYADLVPLAESVYDPGFTERSQPLLYLRSANREPFLLHPLVTCNKNDVFVWDGAIRQQGVNEEGSGERCLDMVSYGTGKRFLLPLKGATVFDHWLQTREESEFTSRQLLAEAE